MPRILKITEDGSHTLYVTDLDETYHSNHGALQEANHVFIKNGIKRLKNYNINILELGFGTGLNPLVTLNEYLKNENIHSINYFTLEKYPLDLEEIEKLNYSQFFDREIADKIPEIHKAPWEEKAEISKNFYLKKIETDFFNLEKITLPAIDLVYFDCFGSQVQPELWEEPLIRMVSDKMAFNGLFTTYSSKGSLKRILKKLNFEVEKLEGPKGKREMINAWKR